MDRIQKDRVLSHSLGDEKIKPGSQKDNRAKFDTKNCFHCSCVMRSLTPDSRNEQKGDLQQRNRLTETVKFIYC
ncbi:unnamed protein product [Ectocarpus sp. 12 AP-2014]